MGSLPAQGRPPQRGRGGPPSRAALRRPAGPGVLLPMGAIPAALPRACRHELLLGEPWVVGEGRPCRRRGAAAGPGVLLGRSATAGITPVSPSQYRAASPGG